MPQKLGTLDAILQMTGREPLSQISHTQPVNCNPFGAPTALSWGLHIRCLSISDVYIAIHNSSHITVVKQQ